MIKILHFADAHIDLARQGKHDPQSGLPLRVLDFLKSLDTIVDTAIGEKADLVIFAGDAYRDRTPAPTYQREWGKRIMRLSSTGIPTLMVIGNHDVSPASGRANALQEFETLQVPNVRVISKPCLLKPEDLNGLPLQVIGIPWLNRSGLAAAKVGEEEDSASLDSDLEANLTALIEGYLDALDPRLPAVLAGHLTVQGAVYGNERSVMLGRDFMLPGSLVRDPRLDYVALGHIHKFQNLNPEGHPPVIYPGSIERIDFGEAQDRKVFMMVGLEKGKAEVDPRELPGRKFIDLTVALTEKEGLQEKILAAIPSEGDLRDAIFRLVLNYPRDLDTLIDDADIRRKAQSAFEFHLIRRPHIQARLRLSGDRSVASMTSLELLDLYWDTLPGSKKDIKKLDRLAGEIFASVEGSPVDEEAGS